MHLVLRDDGEPSGGIAGTMVSLDYCFQPDPFVPAFACDKEARALDAN